MLAASAEGRLITIEEAARTFHVSKTHLNKVANVLTRAGFLKAVRGRSGGLTLGKPADAIRIGDVLRITEPDFALVECFTTGNQCVIAQNCKLSKLLSDALMAFRNLLDEHTLADITLSQPDFLLPAERNGAYRQLGFSD